MTIDWARDWNKQWFTADPGTVVVLQGDVTDHRMYTPVLWAIKDRLTSAGTGAWTVLASSGKAGGGSLVASTNDNWISSDDVVSGLTDTDDRSWILLKSPTTQAAGTFYLLLDYRYNNVTDREYRFQMTFTKSQPDISSPATNARPPATGDEWYHSDVVIVRQGVPYGQNLVSLIAVRAHDGSFYVAVAAPYSGEHRTVSHYLFNVLRSPKIWDTTKAASWVATYQVGDKIQWEDEIVFKSLHSDGSEVELALVTLEVAGGVPYSYTLTDPWTGKWITWPAPLICRTSGKKTFRGELEDIFLVGDCGGEGTIFFSNGVPKAIRIGPWSVPFDQLGGTP